jgi:hypothetical protein
MDQKGSMTGFAIGGKGARGVTIDDSGSCAGTSGEDNG